CHLCPSLQARTPSTWAAQVSSAPSVQVSRLTISPVVFSGPRRFVGQGRVSAAGTCSRITCGAVTTAGLLVKQPVKIGRHTASKIGPDILVRILQLPDLVVGVGHGRIDGSEMIG